MAWALPRKPGMSRFAQVARSARLDILAAAVLALGAVHCGDEPGKSLGEAANAATEGGVRAYFASHSGGYVVAEGGGGQMVNANRAEAGPWETFTILDLYGGQLENGDVVRIRTNDGRHYLSAPRGGGYGLTALPVSPGATEAFLLERVAGPGVVQSGDAIALRTLKDFYVVAEGGGGQHVAANRPLRGPWETFTITLPDATHPPPPPPPEPPAAEPGNPNGGVCTSNDPLTIVKCERAKYGAMTPEQIVTLLTDIAKSLNRNAVPGGPYGILKKAGGNNCGGYSCDIICAGQGQAQKQWDVLVGDEALSPRWPSDPLVYPNLRLDECVIP